MKDASFAVLIFLWFPHIFFPLTKHTDNYIDLFFLCELQERALLIFGHC